MAKLGYGVLVGSGVLSLLVSLTMVASPFTVLNQPRFRVGEGELLIRGWGVTWLGLSVVLLAVLLTRFRRGDRWAWLVMATVPVLWLAHQMLARDTVHNLVLAIATGLALAMTFRYYSAKPAAPDSGSAARAGDT